LDFSLLDFLLQLFFGLVFDGSNVIHGESVPVVDGAEDVAV
jgi:hypothetical protein